jgi:hypothetical protein
MGRVVVVVVQALLLHIILISHSLHQLGEASADMALSVALSVTVTVVVPIRLVLRPALVSVVLHTSAYISIHQHT